MALTGIKVVEMAGLAPAPFCGMILSDFGAKVIRVDKTTDHLAPDSLCRGKQAIAVNLKQPEGVTIVKKLCESADVLIEPYRPGVMEKLGLGPDVLLADNPRLIYARLTGFGQKGYYANRAGHDINYLAVSGVLSALGRKHEKPYAPINLLADFAGGGLTCALGITMALFERTRSGKGQVIDTSMVEGAAYIGAFLWKTRDLPIWGENRGEGWLDGGSHYYDTFQTKDGKYMAVGALEPQFYMKLLKGLELSAEDTPQFGDYKELHKKIEDAFLKKTQKEWCDIFDSVDACVTPVLEWNEAHRHQHNIDRNAFLQDKAKGQVEPKPAPQLQRTPGHEVLLHHPVIGENSSQILKKMGYSKQDIDRLLKEGTVCQTSASKL